MAIDVKKNWRGSKEVFVYRGSEKTKLTPIEAAQAAQKAGAGEILLTSIDHEGEMSGYDLDLIDQVSKAVSIPVIAHGGARNIEDFWQAVQAGASAVAAGSLFVLHGKHRAVLIQFPSQQELKVQLYFHI